VILRDLEEFTYEEIADVLKVPIGTVKSRINRGRTELARQIKRLKTQYEQQAESSRRGPEGGGGTGTRSGVSG
jgi:predicted DNA-binding protein (UPF0251 family)